jgi:inorganic pyrophosphatase/manganese-dependent inorganic pyrophosphatase
MSDSDAINYINENLKCDKLTLITPGSTYIDVDAYACMAAMSELMELKGEKAIAYSRAPCNYSVCDSLTKDSPIVRELPVGVAEREAAYVIVDVSDPSYLGASVPLDNVVAVYDHHTGFESYWSERIGNASHIEFIGAAATLIYREWRMAGLADKMKSSTARLLIAAILDNTLNLTSAVTTSEDIETFKELCEREGIGDDWCAAYFSEVQQKIEADLKNALFNDTKRIGNNDVLPQRVAQLAVWDTRSIIGRLDEIRVWFDENPESWMINIIDIQNRCGYFVCDNEYHQRKLEDVFNIRFTSGVARSSVPYLRKEIIKKIII